MATREVNDESLAFMDKLLTGDIDELNELKAFLFKENIRIETERASLKELQQKVFEDRERLRRESDDVNRQIVKERQRLKDEELFFDKKMQILKNGFTALETDRKALQNARQQFEYERKTASSVQRRFDADFAGTLFRGANSLLSLKKRYKDLLKIFHPDNMGGDHEMVLVINQIYEELKKNYEGSKII